jgi:uncharacterized Tic20 family protein
MSIRFQISILVYVIVHAVIFGVGIILVFATPLSALAMNLMPWVVGVSAIVTAPVAWIIAPRLRTRFQRQTAPGFMPAE